MMRFLTLCLAIPFILPVNTHGGSWPKRVITLAPNVTETVYALGQGDKIIAVSRQCDYPPAVKEKPKIGDMVNPSVEKIVSLKPDVVILTDDGNPKLIWDRLKELKITTYVYRPRRLKELPFEVKRMGHFLGAHETAEMLARQIEASLTKYATKQKKDNPQKVAFVLQTHPIMVAGPHTAIDDVITLLGLTNIASRYNLSYPTLSREELAQADPDVIFVGHNGEKGEISRWKELKAVRTGRIYIIGPAIYRMSPRLMEGIKEMADHLGQ